MKKRKAAAAAAVTVAAASIMTNAAFETPAELLPELAIEQQQDDDAVSVSEERQKGPAAKVRAWVLSLPAAVRMLVAIPLWVLGWVLLSAVSVFWAGTAPVFSGFLNWACLAVVLLGVFACSAKAAFPQVPMKRLLRRHNVLFLVLTSAVLWAADLALPAVWDEYNAVSRTVWRVGAACLLAFLCCAELKRQGKRAVKQQAKQQPERTAVEIEARRLADSVCGK